MMRYFSMVGVGFALLLTGCAGTNSDFECNATTSDSCMTMEEANQKAKSVTDTSKAAPVVGVSPTPASTALPKIAPLSEETRNEPQHVALSSATKDSETGAGADRPLLTLASCTVTTCPKVQKVNVHRLSEGVARLWVAPYIDADDVLHQPGNVHFVVKPGNWQQIQSL